MECSCCNTEDIYCGAIVIFYKGQGVSRKFLVVENAKTGNVTFVSGAQESDDKDLLQTAQREVKEELGLDLLPEQFITTEVYHNFVYSTKKPERQGCRGSNKVFMVDTSDLPEIGHTAELKKLMWLTEKEVAQKLTFPDLREVFKKVILQTGS
ncbi:MAG: NUDIX domain-containing protein [Patescibacteria group bacterium]|jgi:8-oxo-dGTP pyrophosphatase MutT (NUDIX family)